MNPSSVVLWKQCREVVLGLRVDPGPVAELVGPDFALALEDGRARVAVMAQDCCQYWLNGEDLGPTHLVHVLAAIEGAEEARPVVGAQRTLPAMRWFALFTGSTNERGREVRSDVGRATGLIDRVWVGSESGGESESVESEGVESETSGALESGGVEISSAWAYKWSIPRLRGRVHVIGVDHEVYSRDDRGEIAVKRIQALGRTFGEPARGMLEASAGVEPTGVVPPGSHPALAFTFQPVWAQGELRGARS